MRNHLMIDLETMDTLPTAAILSVGAAFFDPHENWEESFPEDMNIFYRNVDLQSSIENGGTVSGNTVMWWMKQGQAAVEALTDPKPLPIKTAMNDLKSWFWDHRQNLAEENGLDIKEIDIYVWAKGSNFDHPILSSTFHQLKTRDPWMFWNARDVRTSFHNAFGKDGPTFERFGDLHNALHDSLTQIIQLQEAYRVGNFK